MSQEDQKDSFSGTSSTKLRFLAAFGDSFTQTYGYKINISKSPNFYHVCFKLIVSNSFVLKKNHHDGRFAANH